MPPDRPNLVSRQQQPYQGSFRSHGNGGSGSSGAPPRNQSAWHNGPRSSGGSTNHSKHPVKLLRREWVRQKPPAVRETTRPIRIMSWNLLAQALIRQLTILIDSMSRSIVELLLTNLSPGPDAYPQNNCLNSELRDAMLAEEIMSYDPDIACLQEVDRVETRMVPLNAKGFSHSYVRHPEKKHGAMIIWKNAKLQKIQEKSLLFDDLNLRDSSPPALLDENQAQQWLKASSRVTTNNALILALRKTSVSSSSSPTSASSGAPGYVVVSCHLFWHPKHYYERVRQGALLLREITRFQAEHQLQQWPIVLAGDFNSAPTDPLYALLVGEPLSPQQIANIEMSTLVHASVDPSVPITVGSIRPSGAALKRLKRQAMNPAAYPPPPPQPQTPVIDPSEELVNARAAVPEDGLLSVEELSALFPGPISSSSSGTPFTSVYDSAFLSLLAQNTVLHPAKRDKIASNVFRNRPLGDKDENYDSWDTNRKGANEPMYTNYTKKWHFTVDYIFIRNPLSLSASCEEHVAALLCTPEVQHLAPGLPKKGITASDHVSLVADIDF